jgi:hypothetical protein
MAIAIHPLERIVNITKTGGTAATMFFISPEDARWNPGLQAVEFEVEIGEYHGVVWVPRRGLQQLSADIPLVHFGP